MGIGGSWDGTPPDSDTQYRADAVLDAAIEAGINVFDHADIYCRGASEAVFGDWMQRRLPDRDSLWIQSKGGICLETDTTGYQYQLTPSGVRKLVEQSLRRLCIDYLDCWMIHRPDPLVELGSVADELIRLREEGKVRHFGASNMPAFEKRSWEKHLGTLAVIQQEMSLARLDWLNGVTDFNTEQSESGAVAELLACSLERGDLQLQAWGSTAQSLWGNKGSQSSNPALVELMSVLTERYACNAQALAIAFVLRHPAAIQPVIGTTRPDRIRECMASTSVKLTREDWYALYSAARTRPLP